ncbi:MAG TPA: LLM class flavin-dependent oxidoreductase, partial [Patescibacteria group bacterium]|nr:LLM class flavin-dependent oxidoreductase [Patescibacteria group bacterium]
MASHSRHEPTVSARLPLKASIRFNNDLPVARFARMAALAEQEGFDQIWVSNDLFWRSAPVLLAAAAAATTRIAVGAGVFNPVSMHVAEIAMASASIQEVSGGRFLLGIGAGADRFLEWAGLAPRPPVARTRTAIAELRALLSGEAPAGWSPDGRLRIEPGLARVPIYVGAMGPRMLEMAGEVADGALPLLFPPEHFAAAAEQVALGARRAGREPGFIDVAACVWCSIDDDRDRARRALAEKIAYYGPSFSPYLLERASISMADFRPVMDAMSRRDEARAADLVTPRMLSLGIAGNATEVAERCVGLIAAGARHISFGPPLGPDPERAVTALGRDVLPILRAAS